MAGRTLQAPVCQPDVRAKIDNMTHVLERYRYNHPEADFSKEQAVIERGTAGLSGRQDVAGIMGIEGVCSSAYFSCFGRMFRRELQFTGRVMHPSPDPVNALLSLGYMLVVNELASLLEGCSLDPFLGFIHGIRYGRKSLALDMVEQFRQPLVDQFTLSLANLKIFDESDFESVPDEGVHLKDEQFRDYLAHYEDRLGRKVDIGGDEHLTWRDLFRRQVERLASAVQDGTEYEPYTAR